MGEKEEAQTRADEISSELIRLYERVRELERELAKYDRIANPDDYD